MDRTSLARLLSPRTVAVVGASESLGMSNNAIRPMLDAGLEPRLVNPNRPAAYGRPTFPSLTEIGAPVDAVLSLVNAQRSVDVVEEAAALGCGGVVVAAGGFAEMGDAGAALEGRLRSAATSGDVAVVGPNCSGFVNVPLRVNLFTGGRIALAPGPVAVVSQSGFLVRACLAAALGRQLGVSVAVSSGNEAVCGLADYIEVLADDPHTGVICLVVEKVRDPERFFAAVERARSLGREVLALKLGRTPSARAIMQSHTGAIADEAWVYDVGLRQAGVHPARDIDELLDMAQILAQLPAERRRRVRGVGVVTSSGGVAAVAADAAHDAGVTLPVPEEAAEWLRQTIPGEGTLNPLDMTGFVMRDPVLLETLFERLASASSIDALVLCWWAAEGDEDWSRILLEPFAAVASRTGTLLVVTPVEATSLGAWTAEFKQQGVVFCRGLESTYRALLALDRAACDRGARDGAPEGTLDAPPPTPAPAPAGQRPELVASPAGPMVPFGAAMDLLRAAGFEVAPYLVLAAGDAVPDASGLAGLGSRLVVKLADVPHRTELGAVRVGVEPSGLAEAVEDLRRIAAGEGLPGEVAVQAMVAGHGEAFLGIQGRTDLGPIVLLGRGGVQVEADPAVQGRLLPLGERERQALAGEVAAGVRRGESPWAAAHLADALHSAERLWERSGGWLASADLNPLIVTGRGLVAVDALLLAADPAPHDRRA